MNHGSKVRRLGAAAVLSVVLVAGCTPEQSDPTPQPSPSESRSASASAKPSESPTPEKPVVEAPERPAAMEQETLKGATAAAEYFMHLYPYIFQSGDVSEWDRMSGDICSDFCSGTRNDVKQLHGDGGYATGGEVEILSRDAGGPYDDSNADDVYVVELEIRFAASEHHYGDGSTKKYPAAEEQARIFLNRSDTAWQVLDVTNPVEK